MEQTNAQQQIDLRILAGDVLRCARRLFWLLPVLAILLGALLGGYTWYSYSPRYQASASFTVYVTNPLYASVRAYHAATAEQMAKTFPYILTSGVLSDLVREDLQLESIPPVTASALENTNLFTLSVTAGDPELAWRVLESVIRNYPQVAEYVVGPTELVLLDESGVPQQPVNAPGWKGAAVKGAAAGCALWLALLVLLAMTRRTVHNEEELKRITNLRCFGTLPTVRTGKQACPLVTQEHVRPGFSESVQLLRVRMEKQLQESGGKVLLVSSATPGEGKTTVTANLAAALAMRGHSTLVLDCDLRNPSVAEAFGRKNESGFSDYLQGKAYPLKIIQKLDVPGLAIIPGGKPAENAAELLAKKEARRLIALLRGMYEYILLDTPPCSTLADASELAGVADGMLMVIRENFVSQGQIFDGLETMQACGVPVLGCVLNGAHGGALRSTEGYYGAAQ